MTGVLSPGRGRMGALGCWEVGVSVQACERCTNPAEPTEAGPGLCPDCTRSLAATIALGRRRAECAWIILDPDQAPPVALHHAALSDAQAASWGEEGALAAFVTASCGASTTWARTPDPRSARLGERCASCCAALGYRAGLGSPLTDPACFEGLQVRLAARGTAAAVAGPGRPPGVGVRW